MQDIFAGKETMLLTGSTASDMSNDKKEEECVNKHRRQKRYYVTNIGDVLDTNDYAELNTAPFSFVCG